MSNSNATPPSTPPRPAPKGRGGGKVTTTLPSRPSLRHPGEDGTDISTFLRKQFYQKPGLTVEQVAQLCRDHPDKTHALVPSSRNFLGWGQRVSLVTGHELSVSIVSYCQGQSTDVKLWLLAPRHRDFRLGEHLSLRNMCEQPAPAPVRRSTTATTGLKTKGSTSTSTAGECVEPVPRARTCTRNWATPEPHTRNSHLASFAQNRLRRSHTPVRAFLLSSPRCTRPALAPAPARAYRYAALVPG